MKYKLLFILNILFCEFLFSQAALKEGYVPKINNLPTSPEVALLGRFGDVPIGYYTGTSDVSIPIYTIKEGDFELPIVLQYHTSGIKVDDQATWVGLGWNLASEGVITQEVRGIRDTFDDMKFTNTEGYQTVYNRISTSGGVGNFRVTNQIGDAEPFMWNPAVGEEWKKCCNNIGGGGGCLYNPDPSMDHPHFIFNLFLDKGQPDIYHFSFAGNTGKFYINPNTRQIVQLNQSENIKFEVDIDKKITAVLSNGNEFIFDVIEESYFLGTDKYSEKSGRTYKLSKINVKSSGTSIKFNYINAQYSNEITSEYDPLNAINYHPQPQQTSTGFTNPSPVGPSPLREQFKYNIQRSEIKMLSSISTKKELITFNLEDREDIVKFSSDNMKRVKSIDVSTNYPDITNKKVKTFEFGYSYFPYTTLGYYSNNFNNIDSFGKRLKLDYFQEYGYDKSGIKVIIRPPYRFEYDTTNTMPARNSYSKDMWGYYNGTSGNKTLLPELGYFNFPYMFKGYMNNQNFKFSENLNNRYADLSYAKTYSLNKIIYPAGGYTKFEYELNTFTNQFIPNKELNAIARKAFVVNNPGYMNDPSKVSNKSFKPSKTTTLYIEKEVYDGYTPYNNPNSPVYVATQMNNLRADLVKTTLNSSGQQITSVITSFTIGVTTPDLAINHRNIQNFEFDLTYDPNATYQINIIDPTGFYISTDSYRIAGMKISAYYYDDAGVDTSQGYGAGLRVSSIKNFDTNNKILNNKKINYYNGKLLNRFDPIQIKKYRLFACGGKCPNEYLSQPFSLLSINTDDLVKYSGADVGYTKVIENDININNNEKSFNKEYTYYNFENQASNFFPVIENPLNGKLSTEIITDGINKKTEKIYSYINVNNSDNIFQSIKMEKNIYNDGTSPCIGGINSPDFLPIYSYFSTPLISTYYKISGITFNEYLNGTTLTTKTNYKYYDFHSLSTEETTFPDMSNKKIKYSYASNTGDVALIQAGMTEVPRFIEEFTTKTNVEKITSRTEIKYEGPTYRPTKIIDYDLENSSNRTHEISYKYNNESNLSQYTRKDGVPVAIIWGYNNTYPIAKVEGATYPDSSSPTVTDIPISLITSLGQFPSLGSLDSFRKDAALANYQITTYTYDPLIGVTSITPPSGIREIYKYDNANRLEKIVDANGNILKEFKYNYSPITSQLYSNTSKSQTFTKNNCEAGYVGSNFTYTVSAGIYTSSVSQDEADALALQDIQVNGQTAANTNGNCTLIPPPTTCTFSKNVSLSSSTFNLFFSNVTLSGGSGTLILAFGTSTSYVWGSSTFIGTISGSCAPSQERSINVTENGRTWNIIIQPSGQVYLKHASAPSFTSNTTISLNIPFIK